MSADDALLFIDANKYLDLYRTDKGKKLLAPLGEQVDYIFVTQQVVDEVQRNKIQVAADFLSSKFKELKLQTFNVPDHLTGTEEGQSKDILKEFREISDRLKKVSSEVDDLGLGIIDQINNGEDKVSKALAPIFARAAKPSEVELQRARARREFGNPPGKANNPLGDQLTWEQILSHFQGKRRLWIISRDGDYGTTFGGKGFLNSFLFKELKVISPNSEAFLFSDTVDGITHFVNNTDVTAVNRLSKEEVEEIEKEEKSLPPLRRRVGRLSDFFSLDEELRKAFRQAASNLSAPSVQIRKTLTELPNLPDPSEEIRRAMRATGQFHPTDDGPKSNEEDEANNDLENDNDSDNTTDDRQP